MTCAQFGKFKFVQILLQSAREAKLLNEVLVNVNTRMETYLYCAVKHRRLEIALEILDAATSVKVLPELMKTDDCENCFSEAVLSGDVKMVRDFLQHGRSAASASMLHKMLLTRTMHNSVRWSCLHLTIHKYNPEIFMALLEAARGEADDVLPSLLSVRTKTTGERARADVNHPRVCEPTVTTRE
jgi:hypothetical protein